MDECSRPLSRVRFPKVGIACLLFSSACLLPSRSATPCRLLPASWHKVLNMYSGREFWIPRHCSDQTLFHRSKHQSLCVCAFARTLGPVARCGPSRGAGFATGLRGGGSADFSACRTVRRCTRWRRASSRIDEPLSRLSLWICSNSPTFDNSSSFAAGKSDSTERRHWIGRRWCPHVLCQGPAPLIRDGRGGVRQPPTRDEEPRRGTVRASAAWPG